MRTIIQRVSSASVAVEGTVVSQIQDGLLLLLGIESDDTVTDIEWLTRKIANLRIFNDATGTMNLSLIDTNYDALVISQFTLHAKTKKGNRPSYIIAARPELAKPLYNKFTKELQKLVEKPIKTGEFGAMMNISLENSGPVTIIIDTKNKE